jgi:hypothetical protein
VGEITDGDRLTWMAVSHCSDLKAGHTSECAPSQHIAEYRERCERGARDAVARQLLGVVDWYENCANWCPGVEAEFEHHEWRGEDRACPLCGTRGEYPHDGCLEWEFVRRLRLALAPDGGWRRR